MSIPEKKTHTAPIIRWIGGNLQIGTTILPWQHCTVELDAIYEFEDPDGTEIIETNCVIFKFSSPGLVPEYPPDKENPEEWIWVIEGELAEAVRQFLTSTTDF